MHRGSRLLLGRNNVITTTQLLFSIFVFSGTHFFEKTFYVAGGSSDYSRGCEQVICKIGEECVNRKFWCKYSPCPSMTYCSKSKKESLKGPDTCESVLCTSGYKCLVRARGCEWNQSFSRTNCKERTARCVSEWEFQNDPASCVDDDCPSGHRCILTESHCYQAPCKLAKSCAEARDVQMWFDKCKQLGCVSEQQCFLRRSTTLCNTPSCNHVPHCIKNNYYLNGDYTLSEYCRGWICPPNQECSASYEGSCQHENCRVMRTCQGPLLQSFNKSSDIYHPVDIFSSKTTLADLEREAIIEENRKLQRFLNPTTSSNITKWMRSSQSYSPRPTPFSMAFKNPEYATENEMLLPTSPNIRSTSFGNLPWLTYFKKKAGAHAVQYWIEKAKNNENFEGFEEWLDSVENLLDIDTYRLWMQELENVSTDIPEFHSWILLHNLGSRPSSLYNRELHSDTGSEIELYDTSINDDSYKNMFLNKVQNSYGNKQEAPRMSYGSQHGSAFENSYVEHRSKPTNFKFNELQQFDTAPAYPPSLYNTITSTYRSKTFRPFYNSVNKQSIQNSNFEDFAPKISGIPIRQTSDNGNKQWKPWISYHFNPTPPNNFEYSSGVHNPSYLDQNLSRQSVSNLPHEQNNLFYLQNQNNFETLLQDPNVNSLTPPQPESMELKGIRIMSGEFSKPNYKPVNAHEKISVENPSVEVGTLIQQISDFPRFNQIKNNFIPINPEEHAERVLFPPNSDNNNLPKLLIYFPPPLNFFIYYSAKSSNYTNDNSKIKSSSTNIKNSRMTIPWHSSNFNTNSFGESFEETLKFQFDSKLNKLKKQNKQKEFEYIRKIIRELIEYWDDEEKFLDNSKEEDYDNSRETTDSRYKDENKSKNYNYPKNEIDNDSVKPTFNTFLKWLIKNSNKDASLLDQKPRKKKPLIYKQSDKHILANFHLDTEGSLSSDSVNPSSFSMENADDTNSKKIRILVDIDKNPDLMQSFYRRHSNAHSNKSDTHEYQIIVNLQDFFDPKEEDIISRKLIDIAANQLHKNVTNNQKMPRTLWVFPIYEDEEDDALINELENNTKQNVNNILEDENLSTTYRNENSNYLTQPYYKKNHRGNHMDARKEFMQHDSESMERDKSNTSDNEDSSKDINNNYEEDNETPNKRHVDAMKA